MSIAIHFSTLINEINDTIFGNLACKKAHKYPIYLISYYRHIGISTYITYTFSNLTFAISAIENEDIIALHRSFNTQICVAYKAFKFVFVSWSHVDGY